MSAKERDAHEHDPTPVKAPSSSHPVAGAAGAAAGAVLGATIGVIGGPAGMAAGAVAGGMAGAAAGSGAGQGVDNQAAVDKPSDAARPRQSPPDVRPHGGDDTQP